MVTVESTVGGTSELLGFALFFDDGRLWAESEKHEGTIEKNFRTSVSDPFSLLPLNDRLLLIPKYHHLNYSTFHINSDFQTRNFFASFFAFIGSLSITPGKLQYDLHKKQVMVPALLFTVALVLFPPFKSASISVRQPVSSSVASPTSRPSSSSRDTMFWVSKNPFT